MELILVSCRRNDSGLFVGELQPFVLAKLADQHKDLLASAPYTVTRYGTTYSLDLATLYTYLTGKRIAILIHGYHTDFDGALKAYESLQANMDGKQLPYDVVLGFLWPGGITAAGFDLAVARTGHASTKLQELIMALGPTVKSIDVETHSLGAEVALDALVNMRWVRNLILTAPAVPNFCLDTTYKVVQQNVQQVYVLHSANDSVLKWAFRLATFKKALGLAGPTQLPVFPIGNKRVHVTSLNEDIQGLSYQFGIVTAFDLSNSVHEHSDYRRLDSGTYEIWQALTI